MFYLNVTMKNFYLLLISLTMLFAFSCKKQKDVTIDKSDETFTPMSIGSYWVYDVSNIDTLGNSTFIRFDSTYIDSDTILNGKLYFVFKSSSSAFFTQFLRDSARFLVDESGQRFFHPENFTDTLYKNFVPGFNNDTLSFTYRIMRRISGTISCVAGDYNALDAEMTRYLPFFNMKVKSHNYYAKGVGLILRQDFPVFGKIRTYNLLRFHIEK